MAKASQQQLVQAAANRRAIMGRKNLRRKPVKWLPPDNVERRYVAVLTGLVERAEAEVRKLLPQIVENVKRRQQAMKADDSVRLDDLETDIESINEAVRRVFGSTADQRALAELMVNGVNTFNKEQFKRVVKSVVGVDVFVAEPWIEEVLAAARVGNVALIKSIPDQLLTQVDQMVAQAYRGGLRWESLQADILGRFDVTKSRAELIARDQISKLNGQLTEQRQTNIGITEYIWRTAEDDRVRETHARHADKVYRWSDPPPDTGHPGEDYQCRCYAEAVIPADLLA